MKKYQMILKPLIQEALKESSTFLSCKKCGMMSSSKKCSYCKSTDFIMKYLDKSPKNMKENIFNDEDELEEEDNSDFKCQSAKSESDFSFESIEDDISEPFYMDKFEDRDDSDF
jgi:hypothetical protein